MSCPSVWAEGLLSALSGGVGRSQSLQVTMTTSLSGRGELSWGWEGSVSLHLGGHPQIPSCLIVLCSGEPGAGRKGAVSNSIPRRRVGLVHKRHVLLRVLGLGVQDEGTTDSGSEGPASWLINISLSPRWTQGQGGNWGSPLQGHSNPESSPHHLIASRDHLPTPSPGVLASVFRGNCEARLAAVLKARAAAGPIWGRPAW